VSLPNHHSELLIGCLNLMNQGLKKNMCKLPDAVLNEDVDDLEERTRKIDHSLLYACRLWHKHLVYVDAVPAQVHKITSVLHKFLEEKFLFWLEVLSVIGTVRDAVDALGAAANWLEVCAKCIHWMYLLNLLTEFRYHQPLTLSMTALNLSLNSLRS